MEGPAQKTDNPSSVEEAGGPRKEETELQLDIEQPENESSSEEEETLKAEKYDTSNHGTTNFIEPHMREIRVTRGIFSKQALAFNPLTSFIGFAILWGVAIW